MRGLWRRRDRAEGNVGEADMGLVTKDLMTCLIPQSVGSRTRIGTQVGRCSRCMTWGNEEGSLTLGEGSSKSGLDLGQTPEARGREGPSAWVFADEVALATSGWRGSGEEGSCLEAVASRVPGVPGERCTICPGVTES